MRKGIGICCVIMVALSSSFFSVTAEELNWLSMGTSPVSGGYGEAVVGTGDGIYLVRCLYASSEPSFWEYTPADGVWNQLATSGLPIGAFRTGTALAWDGSRHLYALGGARYADDPNRREFYRYDSILGSWTSLPDTLHAQGAGDALTWSGYDSKLYAFVGSAKHSGGTTQFSVYDPLGGTWTDLQEPWQNTDDGASLSWTGGQYIYALRGEYDETSPTGDFARYNISTGAWEALGSIPGQGGIGDGGSLLWVGQWEMDSIDSLYALSGGSAAEEPGYDVYRYSISEGTWSREADIPCPIGYYVGNRLGYADGKLYYWQGSPQSEKWLCGGDAFFSAELNGNGNGNGDDGNGNGEGDCAACLERINNATKSQFDAVYGIGAVKSTALVNALPFSVSACSLFAIEAAVDAVYGIGEVLRERIVRHFCPELYGN